MHAAVKTELNLTLFFRLTLAPWDNNSLTTEELPTLPQLQAIISAVIPFYILYSSTKFNTTILY